MRLNTALLISLIAHVGLVALLVANFQFSKIDLKQSSTPVTKINAKAVDAKRVEQLVESLKKQKQTQKQNEARRLADLKKAEEEAKKRRQQEEQKAEDARKRKEKAEQLRKDEEKKAADLKKKREQEEVERKKKAAEDKARKQKEEAERKQKADAERKRKEREEAERKRKEKEEAERKRKEAEELARQEALEREMQEQMDAEARELEAARQQFVMSEVDKYNALIKNRIERNWFKPEQRGSCAFQITLAQGGLLLDVKVLGGNQQHCDSGLRAIRRAEPYLMPKDRDVYEALKVRTINLENESNEEEF